MKKIRKIIIFAIVVIQLIFLVGMFATIERYLNTMYAARAKKMQEEQEAEEYTGQANIPLSPIVESYRGQVMEAAKNYGIEQYTDLLLAIMMQESGGLCEDVFQCSESLGKPRNSITVNESINHACNLMSGYIQTAQVSGPGDIPKIKLALQAYNFGGAFLTYVQQNGGEWTQELVNAYAKQKSNGKKNSGSRAERLGEWRYGDQHYTEHVLRYYIYGNVAGEEASGIPVAERMNWLFPEGVPQSAGEMSRYLQTVTIPIVDTLGTESTMQLTVHKNVASNVINIFTELKSKGFPVRATDTAAYCWRNMVSGNNRSAHSYGVAIDVNWTSNPMVGKTGGYYQPGIDKYSITQEVVNVFTKYGFYWGGNWTSSKDYMHFSYINK